MLLIGLLTPMKKMVPQRCLCMWPFQFHLRCQITLRARHIPGCLNGMADLLSLLNQVQSTEWRLHPQVLKQICHSLCRSVCHSSEMQSSIVRNSSPRPTCLGHRCWSGLTTYAYPTTALHRVRKKSGKAVTLSF